MTGSDQRIVVDERERVRRYKDCVHPFHPKEPSGYIGWHAWAEKHGKTHRQHQCPDCGLWLWGES